MFSNFVIFFGGGGVELVTFLSPCAVYFYMIWSVYKNVPWSWVKLTADKTDTAPQKEEAKPPVAKVEENIQGDEPQVKKKKKNKSKTIMIKIPGELLRFIV